MHLNGCLKLCVVWVLLCVSHVHSQERPPIDVFTPQDYNGHNQNWSITQSSNKNIYVANNNGLLEFNGAQWRIYYVPNNTIIRAVNVIDEKVYTGSLLDFGTWDRDEFGVLKYTSLVKKLDIELLEDEEFWNIIEQEGLLLAQSSSRIYLLDLQNQSYNTIESDAPISKMLQVNGVVYFQKENIGLFTIENGQSIQITDTEVFKEGVLRNAFQTQHGLLFLTSNGLFKVSNDEVTSWQTYSDLNLARNSIYSGVQLESGDFVIGTISNGALHLQEEGEIKEVFNRQKGLSNNTVLAIFEDDTNNVWLGLDNGVNCINLASEYRVYNHPDGTLGTVYASIIYDDKLYLGTNQGLFVKKRDSEDQFELVDNTQGQVWQLEEIQGNLFCGHNSGTYLINDKKASLIHGAAGTWDFKQFEGFPNLIFQGNYNGINILEYKNGQWLHKMRIPDLDLSSRFYEFHDNKIFVNHEFKGLYSIEVKEFEPVSEVQIIDYIPEGNGSSIFKIDSTLYYSSSTGIYYFDANEQIFVKDEELSRLFTGIHSLSTILPVRGTTNTFWRYLDNNIAVIEPGNVSSKPQLTLIPVSEDVKKGVLGFENMTKIGNDNYLIGTIDGYVILSTNRVQSRIQPQISINTIEAYRLGESKYKLGLNDGVELNNRHNNIEFFYHLPYEGKLSDMRYQYQLEGLMSKWSDWSTETSHLFENLPFGDYTFKVRGKIGDNVSATEASHSFSIERPLLLSNVFLVLYTISFLLFLFIMHGVYRRYYRRKHRKLVEASEREIEFHRLENDQKVIQLNNEKLKVDIESKNRELAASTMSLIRKNEFLSEIKQALNKVDNLGRIKSVVKTIDTNLNNRDDWKLFEEAFNNADKEFLKKVKEKHPDLTHNDLRLCAYLRLNLASKEIAPLLNISYRSVEVKRYRLRKKMELPHDTSLTNYILEI